MDEESGMSQPCVLVDQKTNGMLVCMKCSQQVERGDSASLPFSPEIPPGELCPTLEFPVQEKQGPENRERAETLFLGS